MLNSIVNRNSILRVAHRGFHTENKLIGFKFAVEHGCDMIECDLRLSADNHPVVIHDNTINRTTNGQGRVAQLKLHELQFYGIPSLEELVVWVKQQPNLCCAFEIKDIGRKNNILVEKTLEIINKHNIRERSVVISFNADVIVLSKKLCPDACTGLVLHRLGLRNPYDMAMQVNADMLWVNHQILRAVMSFVSAREHLIPIFVWTVNNKKDIQALDSNVAGVVSDDLKSLYNTPS
jgi:glycerophosphoryl diester phosphodiesterase